MTPRHAREIAEACSQYLAIYAAREPTKPGTEVRAVMDGFLRSARTILLATARRPSPDNTAPVVPATEAANPSGVSTQEKRDELTSTRA